MLLPSLVCICGKNSQEEIINQKIYPKIVCINELLFFLSDFRLVDITVSFGATEVGATFVSGWAAMRTASKLHKGNLYKRHLETNSVVPNITIGCRITVFVHLS